MALGFGVLGDMSSFNEQNLRVSLMSVFRKRASNIVTWTRQVHGNQCLSHAQIFSSFAAFKYGKKILDLSVKYGRPTSMPNKKLVNNVRLKTQEDRVRRLECDFYFKRVK